MPANAHTLASVPLVLLMACVTTDEVGVTAQEIVGGQTATTTDFPTVVALQHGNGNWFCTGVLVDKDWVMTAASCFDNNDATQARIGDGNLTDGTTAGQTSNITQITKHPQFNVNDTVWRHDVALLKLASSVTDRTPTPIRRTTTTVATGSSFTQAGFGENNNNGGGGGVLRSLTTTNVDCGQAGDNGIQNANLLCFNAADGTGSCWGDGGAPAFITEGGVRVVAGVASGGTGNSCTSGLDVYTSLAPEIAWIDTIVPPATTPPNNPPSNPPPGNPDGDGSGSGSGSGSGRNPDAPDGGDKQRTIAGCSATSGAGFAAFAMVLGALARRRRRR
jgi:uncharacterized protein (TIGR03382 family)